MLIRPSFWDRKKDLFNFLHFRREVDKITFVVPKFYNKKRSFKLHLCEVIYKNKKLKKIVKNIFMDKNNDDH